MFSLKNRFPLSAGTSPAGVDMSHGSGGRAMMKLIETLFVEYFDNELLRQGNDLGKRKVVLFFLNRKK